MLKLAKNAVNKSLIVFKVFLKKILKLFLCHRIIDLKTTLFLMLLLNYYFIEKRGGKKNLIWPVSSGGFEIVFILLAEIIAV